MSATVLDMSMSSTASSPVPTRRGRTGSATAAPACTSGSLPAPRATGQPPGRRQRPGVRRGHEHRRGRRRFGQGRRLFDDLPAEQIELERTRVLEGEGGVTHLHYRVRR
jgi:hypothetical protein